MVIATLLALANFAGISKNLEIEVSLCMGN